MVEYCVDGVCECECCFVCFGYVVVVDVECCEYCW